jgi:hypothetical protein
MESVVSELRAVGRPEDWIEVRQHVFPCTDLHDILQCIFLLFGENKPSWEKCQTLFRDQQTNLSSTFCTDIEVLNKYSIKLLFVAEQMLKNPYDQSTADQMLGYVGRQTQRHQFHKDNPLLVRYGGPHGALLSVFVKTAHLYICKAAGVREVESRRKLNRDVVAFCKEKVEKADAVVHQLGEHEAVLEEQLGIARNFRDQLGVQVQRLQEQLREAKLLARKHKEVQKDDNCYLQMDRKRDEINHQVSVKMEVMLDILSATEVGSAQRSVPPSLDAWIEEYLDVHRGSQTVDLCGEEVWEADVLDGHTYGHSMLPGLCACLKRRIGGVLTGRGWFDGHHDLDFLHAYAFEKWRARDILDSQKGAAARWINVFGAQDAARFALKASLDSTSFGEAALHGQPLPLPYPYPHIPIPKPIPIDILLPLPIPFPYP